MFRVSDVGVFPARQGFSFHAIPFQAALWCQRFKSFTRWHDQLRYTLHQLSQTRRANHPASVHVHQHQVQGPPLPTSVQYILYLATQVPLLGCFTSKTLEPSCVSINCPLVARDPADGRVEPLVASVFRHFGSPRAPYSGRFIPVRRSGETAVSCHRNRKFRGRHNLWTRTLTWTQ